MEQLKTTQRNLAGAISLVPRGREALESSKKFPRKTPVGKVRDNWITHFR
jgi:hypothetical protein